MLYPYGFVPYSLKFSSVYLPYLLVNVCWNHGWHRYHGYTVLFRNSKLVHSISIHLIRVICGGSIRDEKQHIPADFSILPVNGYTILLSRPAITYTDSWPPPAGLAGRGTLRHRSSSMYLMNPVFTALTLNLACFRPMIVNL